MASYVKRGDSYDIRCYCGTDVNGKRINKYMTWTPEPGMTARQIKKELNRTMMEFEAMCEDGVVFDRNMTFADYVNNVWIKRVEHELKPTTFARYKQCLKRVIPALGHYKMCKIQPAHLYSFYDDLREEKRIDQKCTPNDRARELCKSETRPEIAKHLGISMTTVDCIRAKKSVSIGTASAFAEYFGEPIKKLFEVTEDTLSSRTILHHHRLISVIMQSAVYDEIISMNPCQRTKAPKVESKEAAYLSDEEAEHLLNLVLEKGCHPFDIIVVMLLQTGMRRGECCGLCWTDIDFENCTVNIDKALLYLPEKGIFEDDPKTYSSKRVITVGRDVMDILADYKKWQDSEAERLGDKWGNSGRVFASPRGTMINPDSVTKWFHNFVKENDLPYVSIHSLRHTAASILISHGVPITTTAKRLGHSTSATTTRIYAHAIAAADAIAAEKLQTVLPVKRNSAV